MPCKPRTNPEKKVPAKPEKPSKKKILKIIEAALKVAEGLFNVSNHSASCVKNVIFKTIVFKTNSCNRTEIL